MKQQWPSRLDYKTMHCHRLFLRALVVVATSALFTSTDAFASLHQPLSRNSALHMESGSKTSTARRPKKSVRDRTQEETVGLIKDIIEAVVEAGPRAGPARTLQVRIQY